ncbi:MAG: SCO family protein [Gallionellaceae bacterium]|nr:SCO family protein [Gallionellaceae bacterium]
MNYLKLAFFSFCCFSMIPTAGAEPAPTEIAAFYGYTTPDPIGGDFELRRFDTTGEHAVSLQQFRGKYVLLLFGFTHCPVICPTTLARAAQVKRSLADQNDLAIIFITLDPERDSPQSLSSFVTAFDKDIVGLSGSAEDIRKVADQYRVSYTKQATGKSYTIDHSAYLYLIDRSGKTVLLYPDNEPAQHIAQDIKNLIRK